MHPAKRINQKMIITHVFNLSQDVISLALYQRETKTFWMFSIRWDYPKIQYNPPARLFLSPPLLAFFFTPSTYSAVYTHSKLSWCFWRFFFVLRRNTSQSITRLTALHSSIAQNKSICDFYRMKQKQRKKPNRANMRPTPMDLIIGFELVYFLSIVETFIHLYNLLLLLQLFVISYACNAWTVTYNTLHIIKTNQQTNWVQNRFSFINLLLM